MWVEFTGTFRWRPKYGVSILYSPGMRLRVTRRCAAAAIAKGAAVKSTDPSKDITNGERAEDTGAGEAAAEAGPSAKDCAGSDPTEDG